MRKRQECNVMDVKEVADQLNFKPTDEQIQEVIELYDEIADNDPSGNWKLWIEQALYDVGALKEDKLKVKKAKQEISIEKEIEQWLLADVYPTIGMDKPDNHDELLEFIVSDVKDTADPKEYHTGDFGIALRRFIESKQG